MIGGDGNDPHYHSETDQQSASEQYSPLPVEFLHERFPLLLAANRRGGHFRFRSLRVRFAFGKLATLTDSRFEHLPSGGLFFYLRAARCVHDFHLVAFRTECARIFLRRDPLLSHTFWLFIF